METQQFLLLLKGLDEVDLVSNDFVVLDRLLLLEMEGVAGYVAFTRIREHLVQGSLLDVLVHFAGLRCPRGLSRRRRIKPLRAFYRLFIHLLEDLVYLTSISRSLCNRDQGVPFKRLNQLLECFQALIVILHHALCVPDWNIVLDLIDAQLVLKPIFPDLLAGTQRFELNVENAVDRLVRAVKEIFVCLQELRLHVV